MTVHLTSARFFIWPIDGHLGLYHKSESKASISGGMHHFSVLSSSLLLPADCFAPLSKGWTERGPHRRTSGCSALGFTSNIQLQHCNKVMYYSIGVANAAVTRY